jgi:hypothetical protein
MSSRGSQSQPPVQHPWPVPMTSFMQDPSKADYVWTRLHYVFTLPDPRALSPLPLKLTNDERELLERFVEQANSLARTSLLGGSDAVTISFAQGGGGVSVEENLSADDITTGFMVQLRQCFADGEGGQLLEGSPGARAPLPTGA